MIPQPHFRAAAMHAAACLLALALAACGGQDRQARHHQDGVAGEALPTPTGGSGVTGTPDVPNAGDGQAPSLGGPVQPAAAAEDLVIQDGDATPVNPETGLGVDPDGDGPLTAPPATDIGAAEPTAANAVATLRDYYAAINARDFPRAYRYWAGAGSASGQTALQFTTGFANTAGVSVQVGAPGAEDAGAGQRYIQVPVTLSATQADGSVHRFAGIYVLHRTVVDGATPDQRAWRIQSADLREVTN